MHTYMSMDIVYSMYDERYAIYKANIITMMNSWAMNEPNKTIINTYIIIIISRSSETVAGLNHTRECMYCMFYMYLYTLEPLPIGSLRVLESKRTYMKERKSKFLGS